ncbi:MAG: hypothetical protein JNJ40_06875 [Bacteroidia bacterium]|nr:hypothetical protein [Bacteroidia bacterium]
MQATRISKKELNSQVDAIYVKIKKRAKVRQIGVFGIAAEMACQTDQKELHIKELKQQIHSVRPYMEELYGKGLIREIADLPIKVKKLKRLSIYKALSAQD